MHKITKKHVEEGLGIKSKSLYSVPMFLVKKKDGGWRLVCNFRELNKVTKADIYPIPRINQCLDSLGGMKYFSTLDCKSGFNQIAMDPDSQEKMVFSNIDGHWECMVMPYGIINGLSEFQKLMDIILFGLKWKKVLVYINDILIYSKTIEQHKADIAKVLHALAKAGMTIQPEKCTFL